MAFIFLLKLLYGSADSRRALRILREEKLILITFVGILAGRLVGNIITGRIDITVITGLADEFFSTLFIVIVICCCLVTKEDVYKLWLVVAASIFVNEIVSCIEFVMQASIYPQSLILDYETVRNTLKLIEGGERYGSYRVMGLFDSSLKLMAMGCLALPIMWFFAMNAGVISKSGVAAKKVFFITSLIALPVMVVLTGSRTGIIAMILVAFIYLYPFILRKLSRIEQILIISILSCLILGTLYLTYESLLSNFIFGQGLAKSSASRVFQYVYSWSLFLESPLFGYGYARNIVDFIDLDQLDGYFLRTVMEGGLVALISLLGLFRITFLLLQRIKVRATNKIDKEFVHALQVSIIVIVIMMLVINFGTGSMYAFVICGSAIVLSRTNMSGEDETK
jgi:hypothetical protein